MNNTSYIDEIELNNYIQKINCISETIKEDFEKINCKLNDFLDNYKTTNTKKIKENIEKETINTITINANINKYIETLMKAIIRYKDITESVEQILKMD